MHPTKTDPGLERKIVPVSFLLLKLLYAALLQGTPYWISPFQQKAGKLSLTLESCLERNKSFNLVMGHVTEGH